MSDEQSAAPAQGQAAPAPAAPSAGQASEPYFKSGNDVFNTREDLEKAWKDSYLRRDDYTRKTQATALLRQQLEKKEKEFSDRMKEFEGKQKDYETYDKFLQSRPDVYAQLKQMVGRPPSPEVAYQKAEALVNDKTSAIEKELEEFRSWKKEMELEKEKSALYDRFSQEFPDFDAGAIDQRLTALAEGDLEALVRTLYHAGKGEQSPLAMEQKVVENLKKKGEAKTASPKGEPGGKKAKFKNYEEAKVAALRDIAGG